MELRIDLSQITKFAVYKLNGQSEKPTAKQCAPHRSYSSRTSWSHQQCLSVSNWRGASRGVESELEARWCFEDEHNGRTKVERPKLVTFSHGNSRLKTSYCFRFVRSTLVGDKFLYMNSNAEHYYLTVTQSALIHRYCTYVIEKNSDVTNASCSNS